MLKKPKRDYNSLKYKIGSKPLLIIEGKRSDLPAFTPVLRKKGFNIELASSGKSALEILKSGIVPVAIIIYAASLRSSGSRICQSLKTANHNIPIILILDEGSEVINGHADVILYLPFTAQKLINRLVDVLPIKSSKAQKIGPIRLYADRRIVRCLGKKTRLTPRLVSLLSILMDQHGEVLERRSLFSRVWETDYTEDTRTLDVHISWLRRAIEDDPNHPQFLKTIRGVGYQLDL
jgi:DNA-binding response OmpR family regulator